MRAALGEAAIRGVDLRLHLFRRERDAELLLDRAEILDGDVHVYPLRSPTCPDKSRHGVRAPRMQCERGTRTPIRQAG